MIVAGCILIVLAAPTPVPPRSLPCLVVRRSDDAAELARLRRRARTAPRSEAANALRAFVDDAGRRETGRVPFADDEVSRAHALVRDVVRTNGERAVAALRAEAVLRFVDRFDPRTPNDPDLAPIVGGFGIALGRWGAMRDRRLVAPDLVVRVLYAARFNVILRLPQTSGFSRGERRAYFGWLALHAPDVPRGLRDEAVNAFAALDRSAVADEIAGDMLFVDESWMAAESAFARAHARTGSLRLRNAALASRRLGQ